MNRLHVFIIFFIGINKFTGSSSSNNILLLYIVLHTNSIQCIWIQHLLYYHLKQQQYVGIQEGGKRIQLYIELLQGGGKRIRLYIELLQEEG